MFLKKIRYVFVVYVLFTLPVNSASYLGTDLCFTHIIKNSIPGSTADARPNFNLFFLNPINENLMFIADIHYQWNSFTGGYLGALKLKTDLGLKQELSHLLTIEYIGIAPTLLFIKRDYIETYGTYYNSYTESHQIRKNGMAIDLLVGIRQIFGQNRFFSFGWTAEYSYLIPFYDITSIFTDEALGLNCVKAGFSFSFRLPKN